MMKESTLNNCNLETFDKIINILYRNVGDIIYYVKDGKIYYDEEVESE